MTARKHFAKFGEKEINTVQRTVFISSATGSGHVITCTARRWVVSGQLYCFQLPPAAGRREACKPFTDPTSRITNVRINRAAAHRSIFFFGIFSALPASSRLDVQKVRLRRLAIGRTKNLAEKGRGLFRRVCVESVTDNPFGASRHLPLHKGGLMPRHCRSITLPSSARSADTSLTEGGRGAPAGNTDSIPLGRGKSCRKGVGNAVSFPRPRRP